MGKRGAKRKGLIKAQSIVTTKKKVDCGYAKKAKRRALRGVVVPADLKPAGKRGARSKKLLIAAMLADHQIAQEAQVASNAMVVKK